MQLFLTPSHIIIATVVGFLVGSLWYSPFLFLKSWLTGEGVTIDQIPKHTKWYLLHINTYSLIAHGVIATMLALLFDLLGIRLFSTVVSLTLLLTLSLIVTTRFIDMLYTVRGKHYERGPQIKFLVSSGYYLTVTLVMASTLYVVTWL